MTLQMGSTGHEVRQLQECLNQLGYDLDVDGDFGRGTYAALRHLQHNHGLSADGIYGHDSHHLLQRLMAEEWAAEGYSAEDWYD